MSLMANADMATLLAASVVLALFLYVVLDGFDLGLAMLFPAMHAEDRGQMVDSIAPIWDGNETWLVLGGGAVMAAFPRAYAVLMPALYVPIILMLLGLVFRGVAFEFRARSKARSHLWDAGFVGGSAVAAMMQGIALGTFLQGITVQDGAYAGGWYDWLTPFTILTGLGVVAAYLLLGACWLILKTEGRLRDDAYRIARPLLVVVVGAIVAVSLATPLLHGEYWRRWFTWPGIALAAPVPVLLGLIAWRLDRMLATRRDRWPFLLTLAMFALCFVGLGVSVFPWIVPLEMTIWDAAAPEKSQSFLLVGIAVMIPIILGYTAYAYWVFRGKVDPNAGYH